MRETVTHFSGPRALTLNPGPVALGIQDFPVVEGKLCMSCVLITRRPTRSWQHLLVMRDCGHLRRNYCYHHYHHHRYEPLQAGPPELPQAAQNSLLSGGRSGRDLVGVLPLLGLSFPYLCHGASRRWGLPMADSHRPCQVAVMGFLP